MPDFATEMRGYLKAEGMSEDDALGRIILAIGRCADTITRGMSTEAERAVVERIAAMVAERAMAAVQAACRAYAWRSGLLAAGGLLAALGGGFWLGSRQAVTTAWGPMPPQVAAMVQANGVQGIAAAWDRCMVVQTRNGGEACSLVVWRTAPPPPGP